MKSEIKLSDAYPPRLMSIERAAAYVGFGPTKFRELIEEGKMPKSIDVFGSPRWDRLDLDAAVENSKDQRADPIAKAGAEIDRRNRTLLRT